MRYAVCVVVLALAMVSAVLGADTTGVEYDFGRTDIPDSLSINGSPEGAVRELSWLYGDRTATLELFRIPEVHIGGGYLMPQAEPVSVELVDGELHVVMRQRSNAEYPTCPSSPVPDRVWKDIYVCGHDEIVLAETIYGKHVPAEWVPERFTWPEEE